MMTREFDPALVLDRLRGSVSHAVGADLIESGHGTYCGHCEKPFNAGRKPRAVVRVSHHRPEIATFTTAWLICGTCRTEMRRDGKRVSVKIKEEARAATAAWLLLLAPPIRATK